MECSAEQMCHLHLLIESVTKKCDGKTYRQTDRLTDRQSDRQTDRRWTKKKVIPKCLPCYAG